eukprot:1194859-Prorocentrum_minimum.AAC.1
MVSPLIVRCTVLYCTVLYLLGDGLDDGGDVLQAHKGEAPRPEHHRQLGRKDGAPGAIGHGHRRRGGGGGGCDGNSSDIGRIPLLPLPALTCRCHRARHRVLVFERRHRQTNKSDKPTEVGQYAIGWERNTRIIIRRIVRIIHSVLYVVYPQRLSLPAWLSHTEPEYRTPVPAWISWATVDAAPVRAPLLGPASTVAHEITAYYTS